MDWRLALTTFATIFMAELGDKTQLATVAFAARGGSKWSVFLGSAAGLLAATAVAVALGGAAARFVPAAMLQRAAGVAFIAAGVWVLWSSRAAS